MRTRLATGYEEQGVLIWWHLMKENHLASTCTRTAFSIGYEDQGGPYLVAFNEGEPPGRHWQEDDVSIGYEEQGVLVWWHLMKENHLAGTCTRTAFSIG